MTINPTLERYQRFVAHGQSGSPAGVDLLMAALVEQDDFATSRLVDFALSLVETRPGRERLRHYLFQGCPQQRNYAALYFKRRGQVELLDEAVAQGKIDALQAYAK
jgi:hypothetical protein